MKIETVQNICSLQPDERLLDLSNTRKMLLFQYMLQENYCLKAAGRNKMGGEKCKKMGCRNLCI